MKVAIIVGHTKLRQGATSVKGFTEWEFNKKIAESNLLKYQTTIFTHDTYNFGYTSMIKRTASKINKQKFDLVLELHFNAADNPLANGAEALYYFKNKKAKLIANTFCSLMERRFGIKKRGAKALYSRKQRGFAAVYYPEPTTLILEPFFGTNQKDCQKILTNGSYEMVLLELIEFYKSLS